MISQAPVDQTDLIAGYKHASSIRRVKAEDLNKVYDEYSLKTGGVAGKSDAQLQQRAAHAVVAWWQKQQAAQAAAAKPPAAAPPAKPPVAAKPKATVAPAPPATPAPVTPTKPAAPAAPAVNLQTFAKAREGSTPAPKPVTTAQVSTALKAAGLTGSVVPAYALVSAATLQAWIAKVKYNRSLLSSGKVANLTRNL